MAFKSNSPLAKYGAGEPIAAVFDSKRLNQPIEHIQGIEDFLGNNFGDSPVDWVVTYHALGKIVEITEDEKGNPIPADVDTAFPDARYHLELSVLKSNLKGDEKEALDVEKDESIKKSLRTIIATNLAEIPAGTHSRAVGEIVHVFRAIRELSPKPLVYYFFNSGGGDDVWVVTPMANCIRGGVYSGQGYRTNAVDAECGTGTETNLPEGMTNPQNVIIINTEENGLATHWLKQNSWTFGVQRGVDDNKQPIIFVTGGYYRTASPQTVGRADPITPPLGIGDGLNAGITGNTWDRDTSDRPVEIYGESEVWAYPGNCNSPGTSDEEATPKLMGRKRVMSFDAAGRLVSVTYENEFVIAVGCCPERTTTASPAFGPSFATFEEAAFGANTSSNLI